MKKNPTLDERRFIEVAFPLIHCTSLFQITGLETNVNFLIDLASHPHFQSGDVHTGFIPQHYDTLFPPVQVSEAKVFQAALALLTKEQVAAGVNAQLSPRPNNPFNVADSKRLNYSAVRTLKLKFQDTLYDVFVKQDSGSQLQMRLGATGEWRTVESKVIPQENRLTIRSSINGDQVNFSAVISDDGLVALFDAQGKTEIEVVPAQFLSSQDMSGAAAGSAVLSPMPGVLDRVFVERGQAVKKGDPLAVIIAMKMEHVLKAPRDAVVKTVGGQAGDNMAKGAAIVTFEEDASSDSDSSSDEK